jgi:hypothetical protein
MQKAPEGAFRPLAKPPTTGGFDFLFGMLDRHYHYRTEEEMVMLELLVLNNHLLRTLRRQT